MGASGLHVPETGLSHGRSGEVRGISAPEPGGHLRDVPVLARPPSWARSNATGDTELCVHASAGAMVIVTAGAYADYNHYGRKVKCDLLPADEEERHEITKCEVNGKWECGTKKVYRHV